MSAIKITADDSEIRAFIKALPISLNHKVLSDGNFGASKILVQKEKGLAPEGPTGNLVDSIGAVKLSYKNASQAGEVIVGPRRKGGYKGFAGHLVEYGTRRRKTRKGANRGLMPKKPFAKPAFDQVKRQLEDSIADFMRKAVVKLMRKYSK